MHQTTLYDNGFQYVDGVLQFFPHAEGYVRVTDGTRYNYVYNYTDHLGNIRLSYGLDPKNNVLTILEENHYYPFGLKHKNYNMDLRDYETYLEEQIHIGEILIGDAVYKYKYNGKEWQDELGLNFYDYGARNYDAALGRWMNIDPLAELYRRWSPYNYCVDNPVRFTDPDGMWVPGADRDNNITVTKEKGDNKKSFSKFMGSGYSKKEINQMWKSRDKGGSINLTESVGGIFQEMKTAIDESQARGNPTNADFDGKTLVGKNMSENYNCWGASIALNEGKKLEGKGPGTGVGIADPSTFDATLASDYKPTSQDDATVGKTVVRFADSSNESQHGATFMGVDNNGNEYLFSKNGWQVQPEIHQTKYFSIALPSYGTTQGINSGETGYYDKK